LKTVFLHSFAVVGLSLSEGKREIKGCRHVRETPPEIGLLCFVGRTQPPRTTVSHQLFKNTILSFRTIADLKILSANSLTALIFLEFANVSNRIPRRQQYSTADSLVAFEFNRQTFLNIIASTYFRC